MWPQEALKSQQPLGEKQAASPSFIFSCIISSQLRFALLKCKREIAFSNSCSRPPMKQPFAKWNSTRLPTWRDGENTIKKFKHLIAVRINESNEKLSAGAGAQRRDAS